MPVLEPNLYVSPPPAHHSSGGASLAITSLSQLPSEVIAQKQGEKPPPPLGSYALLLKLLRDTHPSEPLSELAEEYQRSSNLPHRPNAKASLNRDDIEDFAARSANTWVNHFKDIQFERLDFDTAPLQKLPLELVSFFCSHAPNAVQAKLLQDGYYEVFPLALEHYTRKMLRQRIFPNAQVKNTEDLPDILHSHAEAYLTVWKTYQSVPLSSDLKTRLERAESAYSYERDITADTSIQIFLRERAIEDLADLFIERHTERLRERDLRCFKDEATAHNIENYYFDPAVAINKDANIRTWVHSAERSDYRHDGIQRALTEILHFKLEQDYPQTAKSHLELIKAARERAQSRIEMTRFATHLARGAVKLTSSPSVVAQIVFGTPIKFW